MKNLISTVLGLVPLILIPTISVFICRLFRIAQGEVNEEIVVGIFVGIILDFIYSIIVLVIELIKNKRTK